MGAAKRHAPWRELTQDETDAVMPGLREITGDRPDLLAEVVGRGSRPLAVPVVTLDPVRGTHKGQLCQEGVGHWPAVFTVAAGLGLTVLLGSSSQLPGSRRRAGGVKLERPQPRSGEDERA
jgi:hypothetical protein